MLGSSFPWLSKWELANSFTAYINLTQTNSEKTLRQHCGHMLDLFLDISAPS